MSTWCGVSDLNIRVDLIWVIDRSLRSTEWWGILRTHVWESIIVHILVIELVIESVIEAFIETFIEPSKALFMQWRHRRKHGVEVVESSWPCRSICLAKVDQTLWSHRLCRRSRLELVEWQTGHHILLHAHEWSLHTELRCG